MKIDHFFIKLIVPAANAQPKAPLATILGQQRVNTTEFCKKFNSLTEGKIEKDTLIPVKLKVFKKDFSFEIFLKTPATSYLLKRVLKEGSFDKKSLYKILLIKSQGSPFIKNPFMARGVAKSVISTYKSF